MTVQSIKHTRGGLVPAKIINLGNQEEVPCMFNPFEYTLSKQNQWKENPKKGNNAPKAEFVQGGKQTLKLTLHFDTLKEGTDVRDLTDPLWKMMMVEPSKERRKSGKSHPPEVAFEWGRLYFKAVVTALTQKFTLFKEDGTPLRCQVDITLDQLIDVNDYKDQQPTTGVKNAVREVTSTAGERLDHIAADVNDGDSSASRNIAAANNIDNPLNIPVGKKLTVTTK